LIKKAYYIVNQKNIQEIDIDNDSVDSDIMDGNKGVCDYLYESLNKTRLPNNLSNSLKDNLKKVFDDLYGVLNINISSQGVILFIVAIVGIL